MARITMRNSQKATFAEVFEIYISAVTARGVKDKTIATQPTSIKQTAMASGESFIWILRSKKERSESWQTGIP